VKGNVPVDNETLLMTDFMNLKIKPAQSFKVTNRDKMYIYIFIEVNACTCINIYVSKKIPPSSKGYISSQRFCNSSCDTPGVFTPPYLPNSRTSLEPVGTPYKNIIETSSFIHLDPRTSCGSTRADPC
jgi:hypothetical protein